MTKEQANIVIDLANKEMKGFDQTVEQKQSEIEHLERRLTQLKGELEAAKRNHRCLLGVANEAAKVILEQ